MNKKKKRSKLNTHDQQQHIEKLIKLYECADYKSLEKQCQRLIKIHGDDEQLLQLLATAYLSQNDFINAYELLSKLVAMNPGNSDHHNNLGIALKQLGKLSDAANHFNTAIQLNDKNDNAYINLGTTLLEQDDIAGAITNYQRALSINNNNAVGHVNLGNALRAQIKHTEAIDEYNKAIELDPKLVDAYSNLSICYREVGARDESLDSINRGMAINDQNYELRWNKSLYHLYYGEYASGWDDYEFGRMLTPPIRNTINVPDHEWHGEDLNSKTILVYTEQGIGDAIMFSSCLGDIIAISKHVYFSCE